MSLEDYKELPTVVQAMKHQCEDHDEPHHMYCPLHNRPCCIRCVLTSHKECSGVAPIADFISIVKSSPAMLDLEQTLKGLGSFVERLTDDTEENIQEILTRKKGICEEIHKIQKSLNKSDSCSFILLNSNVISDVLFSISVNLFFSSPNCKVTSSTVLF
jgi:hypothetical protein